MTNESSDDLARYALKLSARHDRVENDIQRPVVFKLALHDSERKSLLADTALTSFGTDPGVKGIEHTDNIMVSRRIYIDGAQYTIEALFEDIQIPSSILVEHIAFKVDTEQSLEGNDATCQNQCFEESATSFCRSICNADTGLMSMCGKSTNMPNAEPVPFTSGGRHLACSSIPTTSYLNLMPVVASVSVSAIAATYGFKSMPFGVSLPRRPTAPPNGVNS